MRAIGAYEGRGRKYHCILSSIETSLMLSSLPRGVTFMWWRRVLSSVFFIMQKRWLKRGLPFNRFPAIQQIHGTEAENQIDGIDEEIKLPVLPSGQIMNPTEEDVAILHCIGITIGDDNYPAPETILEQQEQQ